MRADARQGRWCRTGGGGGRRAAAWLAAGHQYVVRPPIVSRAIGVPQRGQAPSRRRCGITSPVCTPPLADRRAGRGAQLAAQPVELLRLSSPPAAAVRDGRATASRRPAGCRRRRSRLVEQPRLERRRAAADPRAERGSGRPRRRRARRARGPARGSPGRAGACRAARAGRRRRTRARTGPSCPGRAVVDVDPPGHTQMQPQDRPGRLSPRGTCRAGGCARAGPTSAAAISPARAAGRRRCRDRRPRRSRAPGAVDLAPRAFCFGKLRHEARKGTTRAGGRRRSRARRRVAAPGRSGAGRPRGARAATRRCSAPASGRRRPARARARSP